MQTAKVPLQTQNRIDNDEVDTVTEKDQNENEEEVKAAANKTTSKPKGINSKDRTRAMEEDQSVAEIRRWLREACDRKPAAKREFRSMTKTGSNFSSDFEKKEDKKRR